MMMQNYDLDIFGSQSIFKTQVRLINFKVSDFEWCSVLTFGN